MNELSFLPLSLISLYWIDNQKPHLLIYNSSGWSSPVHQYSLIILKALIMRCFEKECFSSDYTVTVCKDYAKWDKQRSLVRSDYPLAIELFPFTVR